MPRRIALLTLVVTALAPLAAAQLASQPATGDLTSLAIAAEGDLKLNPAIPAARTVLGFELGERPIRHLEIRQYLQALDAASDRLTLHTYGRTHEGRDLYYAVVTSPTNHQRLAEIRGNLAKLADPRTTSDADARAIIDKNPACAWMLYSVHGDELSGCDGGVLLAYRLCAADDDLTRKLLDQLVICIDPLQNPDGRERYLSMLEHLGGRIPTGDVQSFEHSARWPQGRTNHYLFDMNRDWYVCTQPESQGKVETIAAWHPQLLVDGHEMGSTDTYLFGPPTEPLNLHSPPRTLALMKKLSDAQAAALDRRGWSYYSGEWNEGWAIGFADIWAIHHASAGMLYEQSRSAGSFVRMPTGIDRYYREDVARQYVSSVANLQTLADNRAAVLADFYAVKQDAVADRRGNGQRDLFVFVPGPNRTRAADFLRLLQRQRVETFILGDGETTLNDVIDPWGQISDTKAFPPGTIAVSMKQPLSPLARSMLEFDTRLRDDFLKLERRDLELKNDSRLYDISGWSVPLAYDLDCYWARAGDNPAAGKRVPSAEAVLAATTQPAATRPAGRVYGYLIDGRDDAALLLVGRLLQSGWQIRVGNKSFNNAGRTWAPGAFLIRLHENTQSPEELEKQLATLPAGLWTATGTARSTDGPDLGGGEFTLLVEPRIALLGDAPFSSYSYGSIWHTLDFRAGLRTSRMAGERLRGLDLRKYNVLILPDGGGIREIVEDAGESLKTWVRGGGTLIAVGGSAAALADDKLGLSAVRRRDDVLDQLDLYAEGAWRERRAGDPSVAPEQVWEFKRERGFTTTRPADERFKTDDLAALKRHDAWAERFMPRGAILRADLRPEHWLGLGLRERLPVIYGESHALLAVPPVQTAARLARPEGLRVSGLLWPEARERLADAAYCTREGLGRGQVILFAADPTFRGFFRGSERLFLNAVILGPGAGASAGLPWDEHAGG